MAGPRPILLTGPTGQIGWELRRCLAPLGPVVAAGRDKLDLASPDSIRAAIRETGPSLIVNAAAYTAVDRAEDEEALAQAVNGVAPGILAEEAKRARAALIHYSTDYAFDGAADRPYREHDATGPLGAYGRTKLAGERAIAEAGGAYLILRTAWIYSRRGGNFLLTMQRLAGEREELKVVDDQRGSPTWARLVAEATASIVARCKAADGPGGLADCGGLYHLTAAGETTWHGFAEAIVTAMRAGGGAVACRRVEPIPTTEYPTPARRPAYSVLDCGKLERAFGIRPPDWRDQLSLCLEP